MSVLADDINERMEQLGDLLQLIADQVRNKIGAHQTVIRLAESDGGLQAITKVSLSDVYQSGEAGVGPQAGSPLRTCCPLTVFLESQESRQIGFIQLSDKYEGEFTVDDERILLKTARLASGVIENTKLSIRQQKIEWMLQAEKGKSYDDKGEQTYGDLSELNTSRLILDSVGKEVLSDIVREYLDLLQTSSAIYEANGDYALGIFSSGWCRYMDASSRKLCPSVQNKEALADERWHCHQSCWVDASLPAMQGGCPIDVACRGGIRLYALPIFAENKVIGAINFGYSDPPQDESKLSELAEKYGVSIEKLKHLGKEYDSRSSFIIETAKKRLATTARMIGIIVERKLIEDRERKAREEAEAANRLKDEFLATVSHELRTPLHSILGWTELIQLDPGNREILLQGLEVIARSARDQTNIVSDLLDASQILSGKLRLDEGKVNLVDVIQGAVEVCLSSARAKNIRIESAIDPNLPKVLGDKDRLQQVVWNLISNAIKFSDKGTSILVSASISDGVMQIQVKDRGQGIAPDFLPHLFDRFRQADSSLTRQHGGLGLGLSIVKHLVEAHGGKVSAESEGIGQGAVFTVLLPVKG